MKPLPVKLQILLAVLLLPFLLASCGGSDGASTSAGTTGQVRVSLTDAPAPQNYQAVYVTVAEVSAHNENTGWETILSLTPPQTINLLDLVNGTLYNLGVADIEAGHYNQMRLGLGELRQNPDRNILGNPHPYANYLIDAGDHEIDFKVPSGYQSGIKLVNGFDIMANGVTDLILDFDASRSIVRKGNGTYGLKPTIKVLETVNNSVSGTVIAGPDEWLEGAGITAQTYTPPPSDPPPEGWDARDEITVAGATVSDILGDYFMYLPVGTYNMVATKEGYLPGCIEVEAVPVGAYFADFTLEPAPDMGTLSGLVSWNAADDSATAHVSVRQYANCGSGEVKIEVGSLNVADNTEYGFALPAGTYQIIASVEGLVTMVFDVSVTAGDDTVQNIDFTL